ncbi:YdbL family protein [Pontibacter sp. JAM-7]|uniref:YdbL family protein n=1 Tax=Pontibacter sp. JAM-7 TaxID=3366581 RepID=UPI003AF61D9C
MKPVIKHWLSAALLALTCISLPAWAISLDDAKSSGLVGEQSNGYLGAVTSGSSAVQNLINEINKKRKAAYINGANSAGVELQVFEVRMGQRLQQRTPAGQYIQQPDGRWLKK